MDISTREDIEILMRAFYAKVNIDEELSPIFNDIAKIDWEKHMPVICDFWETLLLNASSYTHNAMAVHYSLNKRYPFTPNHFSRWLALFNETVDELYAGTVALLAKSKARSIASLMQFKMDQENGAIGANNKKSIS